MASMRVTFNAQEEVIVAQSDNALQTPTDIAERILTSSCNGAVRLAAPEPLDASPRSTVYRCVVHEAPLGAPASVIVKRVGGGGETYDPNAADGPDVRLFNEWAGLQFLDRLAGERSPAARFYGGDRMAGLVVLEDLGAGAHLDEILLGDDPAAAERALVGLATTLGRMHALTAGKTEEYYQLRASLGPMERDIASYDWLVPRFRDMAAALGVALQPGTEDDLEALRSTLHAPGPFLAYTHADACPDNCVYADGVVRLFDFEGGYVRHALIDGVFARMRFPSCWCAGELPAHLLPRVEQAYRVVLTQGCPAAADDILFYRVVIEACIYWLIKFDSWYPLSTIVERDEEWDMATIRQRLLFRFGIVAQAVQSIDHLPALGATITAMTARLQSLWGTETQPMPYYPAFIIPAGE